MPDSSIEQLNAMTTVFGMLKRTMWRYSTLEVASAGCARTRRCPCAVTPAVASTTARPAGKIALFLNLRAKGTPQSGIAAPGAVTANAVPRFCRPLAGPMRTFLFSGEADATPDCRAKRLKRFPSLHLKPDLVGRGKTEILITLAGISQGDEV
jgi:hypothetical protein